MLFTGRPRYVLPIPLYDLIKWNGMGTAIYFLLSAAPDGCLMLYD